MNLSLGVNEFDCPQGHDKADRHKPSNVVIVAVLAITWPRPLLGRSHRPELVKARKDKMISMAEKCAGQPMDIIWMNRRNMKGW